MIYLAIAMKVTPTVTLDPVTVTWMEVTVTMIKLRLKLKILKIMMTKEINFTVVVSARRSYSHLMV